MKLLLVVKGLFEVFEYFACDVAFEAADDLSEVPPDDRSPRLRGNHVSYGTTTTEQGSAVVHR